MAGELAHASLTDALRWVESTSATGSLRVDGNPTGTLFFEAGRLYFGSVDGVAMSGSELAEAGIDRVLWQAASQRPEARLNFVNELIDVGCPRPAIEQFVRRRLEKTVETLSTSPGPFTVSKGRHGFGGTISVAPSTLIGPEPLEPVEVPTIQDDALVSLANAHPQATITLDGSVWNSLTVLLSPARYVELVDTLGAEHAEHLVSSLSRSNLVTIVQHDPSDPWAVQPEPLEDERHQDDDAPVASTLFGEPEPTTHDDDDDDEYVPDKVGRQAYAAMASMRAASRAEPPPQEKARALRRLIEAVRGL